MIALALASDLIMHRYVICRCGVYINSDLNNGLPLAYALHTYKISWKRKSAGKEYTYERKASCKNKIADLTEHVFSFYFLVWELAKFL
jgi:hypothetical protein